MSTLHGRQAPVADWVTIDELYRDPFPIFERLRAEGGVHWVPAVNRYLVTSYAAVHDTEMNKETFSADEEGSLMKRAMGHSMLRKDDPDHQVERRSWQPVLRPSVVKRTWLPVFEANAEKYLKRFREMGPGHDVVWDFAAPYAAENLRAVIGLHNATAADLQRWSQTLIDATGNYANDPDVWAKGEASFNEVDDALDEMIAWHSKHPDASLLSTLLGLPGAQMPLESIRANVKMTIGGGLNEPRDAIGVAAHALLADSGQRMLVESGRISWDEVFEEAIRWVAPIGMYSRQTTRDTVLQGIRLPAGAKLGICLLSANRDTTQWKDPARFDATRSGEGAHLAFGKGIHVCLGAWIAKSEVATVALPKLFTTLTHLRHDPDRPATAGGWVFRGMTSLPVVWNETKSFSAAVGLGDDAGATSRVEQPKIAVVGAGPAGLYSAQALRHELPDAEIAVLDASPTPHGLIRSGVAPDHQGTKAIASQFNRLFETENVTYLGAVNVTREVATDADASTSQVGLDELRATFDAVVVATGLHRDVALDIPGAGAGDGQAAGVFGAGEVTRALNAHPGAAAQSLGSCTAVVGMGNVAMDLVRLLSKTTDQLEGSDVDDSAHATLTGELRTIHVVGRSLPAGAKFDPVMFREIAELPGLEHRVHGVTAAELGEDPRSKEVAALLNATSERNEAESSRITVEWWFGSSPERIERDSTNHVEALTLRRADGARTHLALSSVLTAIGFTAAPDENLVSPDARAQETGRIEPGLYVAGWARRGPRGTIPTQRADARSLSPLVSVDLPSHPHKPGLAALRTRLRRATTWDGWLIIDAYEREQAPAGRVRAKVKDLREANIIAGSATSLIGERASQGTGPDVVSVGAGPVSSVPKQPVTIMFATESGNAELVAEELARSVSAKYNANVVDLSTAHLSDLPRSHPLLLVCSTYGDGELPASAQGFNSQLVQQRPDLSGLRYAVFGLGDRSYGATYSKGSEVLDQSLSELGAVRTGEYGRHDAGSGDAATDVALKWVGDALAAFEAATV
ncbi:MAG: cytochrome P450 [Galactobacter sp.]|uniref:cytochrome P450 n=1 Tax=Galactobacter sp. TaxID=2676125 RepID=UPI0025B94F7C|nr:cytochrome P450 [Galactobacter sp.]